jgi:hypothetical protein
LNIVAAYSALGAGTPSGKVMRITLPAAAVRSSGSSAQVGIAHAPELFRIADVAGGQHIEPLPLDDEVLVEKGEILR